MTVCCRSRIRLDCRARRRKDEMNVNAQLSGSVAREFEREFDATTSTRPMWWAASAAGRARVPIQSALIFGLAPHAARPSKFCAGTTWPRAMIQRFAFVGHRARVVSCSARAFFTSHT